VPITIGTVTFDSTFNYTISSNTLTFDVTAGNAILNVTNTNGNGIHTISSAVSLADNLNMTHSSTANFTISGAISGVGTGIIKNGAGSGALVLSNVANSYSGATTINQGTLNYSAAGAIPTTSSVTVGNGVNVSQLTITATMAAGNAFPVTVNTNGTIAPNLNITTFVNNLQGTGTVNLTSGTTAANLFSVGGSTNTTFAGKITGGISNVSTSPEAANRLTKTGTSTLTLTNSTSDYTSRTFIAQGIIDVQAEGALGQSGALSAVYVRAIGAQGSLYLDGSGLTLPKTLFLNGAGFASGALRNMTGNNTVGGGVQIGWTGGTETPATDVTINVDLGTQLTLSGVISGSSNLTLAGGGTAIYSGVSANTMSGITTISTGILQLSKTAGVNALTGNAIISPTASLILAASEQIASTTVVTINGGTFNLSGNAETMGSLIYNSGTFTQGGALLSLASAAASALSMSDVSITGNLAFTAAGGVIYNGTTTGASISGNVDLGTTIHVFNINDGAAAIDMEISGAITGTGGITKSTGLGVLRLSGSSANTYSGLTTLNAGQILLNKSAGTNAIGGSLTINTSTTVTSLASEQIADTSTVTIAGGTLNINGHPETIGKLVLSSGTLSQGGALLTLTGAGNGTFTMGNGTSISGNIAMTGNGTITYSGTTLTATLSGNLDLGTQIHSVVIDQGTASSDMVISGIISGTGGITRTTQLGRLEFTGTSANTYTGVTLASFGDLFLNKPAGVTAIAGNITFNDSSGSLTLGASNQISDTSTMTLTSGTFNMGAFSETIGTLFYNSGILNQVGGGSLSLASSGTALSIRGGLTISGPLLITGGGTIFFNNANNGTATISGGLDVGSFPATPTFDIAEGTALVDMDISGIITGTAGLTKGGAGIGLLQFSGGVSNTYGGTTTVSLGTLLLNKSPGFTAINSAILINGGTLSLAAANQIADTAAVTLTSGTFNLAGFTETIGDLSGSAGTFVTLGSGALTVGTATASTTFAGVISGSGGSLTKQGTGTFILTGANSYSGGTLISVGTLQGNTTSLQGNITDNATLVFDQTTPGTYADSISGTGALVKQGSDALTFSNNNTVGGITSVNAGTLFVNGTLGGAGAMNVAPSATLGGTGVISKNITINGTLAPGNSIGTINLVGAQVLTTGSTLEIELNPTTSDLVNITGTLTIQPGSTLAIFPEPGPYPSTFIYTIVQTTAGVFGTFSTVTSSPLFSGSVIYTPLEVLLELSATPFVPIIAGGGNAGTVAHCLDVLSASAGSDLSDIIQILRMLPSQAAIENALFQMQPSAFTALALAKEDDIFYVSNAIFNRLDTFSHSCDLENNKGNHLWMTLLGGYTTQSNKHHEPGFKVGSPGVVLGFDGTLGRNFCLGADLGYTYSHLHWKQNRGHANIQALYTSLYGKWFGSKAYLEGALMGGYDFYYTDRYIEFSTVNRHAKGFHGGYQASAHIKGALTFERKHTIVSPYTRLDFLYIHENSFHESGAKSLNLDVKNKNSDLLSAELGIDLSHCVYFPITHRTLTPFMQVSAIWESRFLGKTEIASLEGGCSMTVKGFNPSRTLIGISAGLNALFPSSLSTLSFFYRGKYGNGFQDNSLYLQYLKGF
jgi:autotransporter-associated beta strand protein